MGRDVESMIRDLMEVAIKMERDFHRENLKDKAQLRALNKVLDVLVGPNASPETREKFKEKVLSGSLNKQEIEIEVVEPQQPASPIDIPGSSGASMGVINLSDMLGKALSNNKKKLRKLQVEVALHYLMQEEYSNLLDEDMIIKNSINMVENEGIVFIDEIDKIVVKAICLAVKRLVEKECKEIYYLFWKVVQLLQNMVQLKQIIFYLFVLKLFIYLNQLIYYQNYRVDYQSE